MEEIEEDDGFPKNDISEEEVPPPTEQEHNPVKSGEPNLPSVNENVESGSQENHIKPDELSLLPVIENLESGSNEISSEKLSAVNLILQINKAFQEGFTGKPSGSSK